MTDIGESSNLEHLGDVRDLHKARAIAAYAKTGSPSLTNQLLFAILAQVVRSRRRGVFELFLTVFGVLPYRCSDRGKRFYAFGVG
jgi:hypothetical protein